MSDQEIDQIEQLQRLGIGLVLGGLAFGGLSIVVDPSITGGVLVLAGLVVWGIEYQRDLTVGIGLGIGMAGVVIFLEIASDTGFSDTLLAGTLVAGGIVDYLLAPAYGKLQEAGERTANK